MKYLIFIALFALSGCASIDSAVPKGDALTGADLDAFDAACKKHKGVFEVRKAYVVMTGKYEYRVTCGDNSNFTVMPEDKNIK